MSRYRTRATPPLKVINIFNDGETFCRLGSAQSWQRGLIRLCWLPPLLSEQRYLRRLSASLFLETSLTSIRRKLMRPRQSLTSSNARKGDLHELHIPHRRSPTCGPTARADGFTSGRASPGNTRKPVRCSWRPCATVARSSRSRPSYSLRKPRFCLKNRTVHSEPGTK